MFTGLTQKELVLAFGGLVLSAVTGLVVYFGKRLIEGTSADARLARRVKVLELHNQLKNVGMTDVDLDKLEDNLNSAAQNQTPNRRPGHRRSRKEPPSL